MSHARQPDRGGADGVVERYRRLGRTGSRLHAARQRHRLGHRTGVSAAPQRHAHPGRLRRRGRDRRRLRRAARRRLLRLRADHRQLFDRLARAGRHGIAGRLSDRASLHARSARHRDRRGIQSRGPRRGDRGLRRRARRRVRHRADARRRRLRVVVHAPAGEAGIAADDRRRGGRPAGDDLAAGHVVRSRRAASDRHLQAAARDDRADLRAQVACLDGLARLRFPRRLVLRLAAARRARRPVVRLRARRGLARSASRSGFLCHHRHVRAVGLGDRRAADHDLHRAGDHRRSCG